MQLVVYGMPCDVAISHHRFEAAQAIFIDPDRLVTIAARDKNREGTPL
ncbi:hypothetical protein ACO0K2_13740 [Undibacterium sp. MH2W]